MAGTGSMVEGCTNYEYDIANNKAHIKRSKKLRKAINKYTQDRGIPSQLQAMYGQLAFEINRGKLQVARLIKGQEKYEKEMAKRFKE